MKRIHSGRSCLSLNLTIARFYPHKVLRTTNIAFNFAADSYYSFSVVWFVRIRHRNIISNYSILYIVIGQCFFSTVTFYDTIQDKLCQKCEVSFRNLFIKPIMYMNECIRLIEGAYWEQSFQIARVQSHKESVGSQRTRQSKVG